MKTRRLILITLLVTGLSLAVGTGGLSTLSAERGVNVDVAPDDEAFLTIPDTTLQCGNSPGNTLFTNQFTTELETVTLTITVPADQNGTLQLKPKGSGSPTKLTSNETTTVALDEIAVDTGPILNVTPTGPSTPDQLQISINATGPGVNLVVERQYTITCPAEGNSGSGPPNTSD